jgi:diaminopimelate epimerase
MKIYLIDGAKNTFALVSYLDFKDESALNSIYMDKISLSLLAKKICNHSDVMVDGCVFVFPSKDQDFAWEFFNSDGSDALMCGNASRAVAIWYHQYINKKNDISYFTPGQIVDAKILSSKVSAGHIQGQVCVSLNKAKYIGDDSKYKIYDTGVPHLCVYIDGKDFKESIPSFEFVSKNYHEKAVSLRFPALLNSKGANVTYVWKPKKLKDFDSAIDIMAMTFERGVENWTLACGTGAIAAAYFVKDILNMDFPINIQMPGGVLEINEVQGKTTLAGPAQVLKVLDLDID